MVSKITYRKGRAREKNAEKFSLMVEKKQLAKKIDNFLAR